MARASVKSPYNCTSHSINRVRTASNTPRIAASTADGMANRMLLTRVQSSYPSGPADGGALQLWTFDETPLRPTPAVLSSFSFTPYWFARGYSLYGETFPRVFFANDVEAKAKVCTYSSEGEVTHLPVPEGWGLGPAAQNRCKTFTSDPGWAFRSYSK